PQPALRRRAVRTVSRFRFPPGASGRETGNRKTWARQRGFGCLLVSLSLTGSRVETSEPHDSVELGPQKGRITRRIQWDASRCGGVLAIERIDQQRLRCQLQIGEQ